VRRLTLLAVLVLGLAACGGSGASQDTLKISFGRSSGLIVPYTVTIARDGTVTTDGSPPVAPKSLTSDEDAKLSGLVRDAFGSLKSRQCPGTFPDEASQFITAMGKTVTVRGTCEPGFTKLWNSLTNALGLNT
jgi:hypothetical protein